VITSISLEHWQNLGPTQADIAREKAGIFKVNRPAVIGLLPPDAREVVAARIAELHCPAVWVQAAAKIGCDRALYEGIEYTLPLLGEVQLINSALAIASCKILQQQGWHISPTAIKNGIEKTQWLGRIQWLTWQNRPLLLDGSHNSASAQVLRNYVDILAKPTLWVMGMLATKDHQDIFRALLKPQDQLYLVPVPDHKSAEPEYLATLAHQVCPELESIQIFPDLFPALEMAVAKNSEPERLIVLCGSLYLVGYFFSQVKNRQNS
jgi:dihydrofolate synthase/folylpolyglutamate synthase